MSKMSKACDISPKVKANVEERDGYCCIICGNPNASGNAHYIARSQCGLGVEQNIVTLCNNCHHLYDNGGQRENLKYLISEYLKSKYDNWDEPDLIYDKWK